MPRKSSGIDPSLQDDELPPIIPLYAYLAWPPGTTEAEKKVWGPNSPIILWAENQKDARVRLRRTITDANDWELEPCPQVIT